MCAYFRWKGDVCLHFERIRGREADRSDDNLEKGKANNEDFMIAAVCKLTLASA